MYAEKAKALFEEGYNCAQAVFLAFNDLMDIDEKTTIKISSSSFKFDKIVLAKPSGVL